MPAPADSAPLSMPSFLTRGVAIPQAVALPLAGLMILLVEDSRFASDALRLMCQRLGARLRRAETLEQARVHLRIYSPHVAIIDLGLPDGCGDTLIRELTSLRPSPVVLGLSGDPDGRSVAMAAGAMGFFEKPFRSVTDFQQAILQHFPGTGGATIVEETPLVGQADPLALHDDLAHAADLLAMGPDSTARGYLAQFLAGVARSAGDADLVDAAREAAKTEDALPRLQRLVKRRLGEGSAF
ncbi:MAG: response regulator [Paracoccaceae bacterium]